MGGTDVVDAAALGHAQADILAVERKLDELERGSDICTESDRADVRLLIETLKKHEHDLLQDSISNSSKSKDKSLPKHQPLEKKLLFLQGKLLTVCKDPEAQQVLSRCVKLDPSNTDAWVALGELFWTAGDLTTARDCLNTCLEQGVSKKALQSLSMLLRQMGSTPKEKVDNHTESLRLIKQAVALDLDDEQSWYLMGNTYLSLFFAMSHDNKDLDAALKAYRKSEAVEISKESQDPANFKRNPDLYFNRAQVLAYLEDFESAVADYRLAKQLDPKSPAEERIADLARRIASASELVAKKGHLKAKRLSALAQSLGSDTRLDAKLEQNTQAAESRATDKLLAANNINELASGENSGTRIDLKLLGPLGQAGDTPVSFLVMDRAENVFGLSVYHLDASAQAKIKQDKDRITIVDPVFKTAALQDHSYAFLQVQSPLHFFINGKLLNASIAHAAMNSTSR